MNNEWQSFLLFCIDYRVYDEQGKAWRQDREKLRIINYFVDKKSM